MEEETTVPLTSYQDNTKHDKSDKTISDTPNINKDLRGNKAETGSSCLSKGIPWLSLCVLTTMNIFAGNVYFAFPFFYIEFVEALNVSRSAAGWIGSIQLFVSLVSGVLFSAPLRRYGNKLIAYLGTLVLCCSLLASSFAPNIFVLYVTFGLFAGLGLGALYMVITVVSQNEFTKHRSKLTTLTFCGYGFGKLMCSPLIVYLSDTYGWRGALLLEAGIVAQMFVLSSLLPKAKQTCRKNDGQQKTEKSSLKSIFYESCNFSLMKDAAYCLYNIGTFFIRMVSIAFSVHMPSRLVHQGISKQEAALLIMIQSVINIVCRQIVGAISDIKKVDRFLVHFLGGTLIMVASFIAAIWTSYTGTVIALVLETVHEAAWAGLLPVILVDLVGVDNISKGFAINSMFFGIATLISPPFTGWLFDITNTYEIPYYVNSGLGFVSLIFVLGSYIIFNKRRHKANSDTTNQSRITTLSELRKMNLVQNEIFTSSLERL